MIEAAKEGAVEEINFCLGWAGVDKNYQDEVIQNVHVPRRLSEYIFFSAVVLPI